MHTFQTKLVVYGLAPFLRAMRLMMAIVLCLVESRLERRGAGFAGGGALVLPCAITDDERLPFYPKLLSAQRHLRSIECTQFEYRLH